MTETASQVATTRPGEPCEESRIAGPPLRGTSVRIHDPDDAGVGEILVRGPTLMRGYFRNPVATDEALRDGWLHTGDVGCLDAAGRLRVTGRRSEIIVTGGENVHPAVVEEVLRGHPDVADVAVFGVPDDRWGERVHAAVVLRSGPLDTSALRAWCRGSLAGFEIPAVFHRTPDLPRTPAGKLRRRDLVAAFGDSPGGPGGRGV